MEVLRTAVVGLGRIGWRFHVPQVVAHPGFELVAVVDPLDVRLAEAREQYGAAGYKDLGRALASEALDIVVVASPTQFHADQAIASFAAGCDVFCDKPMALCLEEADRMIAAAATAGRRLMLYQPHRARADVVGLRDILDRDLIGPVYMMKRTCTAYTRRNDWQAFREHGGGMLNNYGAHFIDQLLYLSGSKAARISCALRTIASLGDADDVVKAVIETESGVILDVDINMAAAQPMTPWQILGARGSVVLDEAAKAWQVRYFVEEELGDVQLQDGLAALDRKYGSGEAIPWRDETVPLAAYAPVDYYAKCYEYFALGEEPFVPVQQTRELMRVLHQCRQDAARRP